MKKTLSHILGKIEQQDDILNLHQKEGAESIELLPDNYSEKIRGGDKEYTPMYNEMQESAWQNPTILLNL
ncbi:hypothetical protein SAMN04515674_10699 [Pseudarcicella hirudinis]|uniref:Uncharacterized protein n=1 Tax=Pseudarcicella hirudinis TaxID=1079859 RepID=A0A1I5TL35_9BACT|nr:hypothetical protein [Pseudarcicella hirudinis]SFP83782.1 hypothetical protein SAMN04515674_10699 [Pseudarcicella hirudinis]